MTATISIRHAHPTDRHDLLALVARIDRETDFLVREPGERPLWGRDLATFQAAGNATVLVAEAGGTPIGYLSANGGHARRNRGVVTLAVGVRGEWWGRGVATRLFAVAEEWAAGIGAHRLELTVADGNDRARALYDRLGFVEEGRLRHALRVRGAWRDEWLMGKLIGADERPDWPPLTLDALPPARLDGMVVRPAEPADASAYLAFDRAVRGETAFLLRTADESLPDVGAARRFLAEQRIGDQMATLLAVADGLVAGSLSLWTGAWARTAHEAGLGLAVRREYWRSGVGSALMAAAERWVANRRLHRLALWVFGHNQRARAFYSARGFTEEATARRHALIEERYADQVLMAKLYP